MPDTDIVIASAARTPVGAFNGGLASLPAHKLGEVAIVEALKRARVEPKEVSEVILGQILAAGEGMNPARQASIGAGIPVGTTAYMVNQVCGSGLRTVALGFQAIRNGDSEIVVAGGQESMSLAPHCIHLRNGVRMGDAQMVDTMIKDGLWDVFNGYHMGNTAENVAQRWQITREQQDEFAARSQTKAEAAQKAGRFNDEIVPVKVTTRRGAGLRRQPRARLGSRPGQCQWRRYRARASDRRVRHAHPRDPAPRNAEARCKERPRDVVHRRRHGNCDVRRTRLIERTCRMG